MVSRHDSPLPLRVLDDDPVALGALLLDDEDDLALGRRHVPLHLRAEVVQHPVVGVGPLGRRSVAS